MQFWTRETRRRDKSSASTAPVLDGGEVAGVEGLGFGLDGERNAGWGDRDAVDVAAPR
jgi:hypothetical protein